MRRAGGQGVRRLTRSLAERSPPKTGHGADSGRDAPRRGGVCDRCANRFRDG